MSTINKAKYLPLLVLLGAWGCTTNQYVSRSGGGYDDLYGGNPNSGIVSVDRGADQEVSRTDNPDYSYTGDYAENGTSDYYDESYLSSRSVKRAISNDVGYNAGFIDGYNQAGVNALSNPYYGGLGSFWPGSSIGLRFGFGNSFGMRPYLGFGMGSMMGMGYSPWGYGSMLGYGGMMGYGSMMGYGYDPFGYNSWGYNPYGFGGGYGYDSFYGGYGYSPWAYSRPVIVVNNSYERGISRTYGPRVASNSRNSRSTSGYNSNYVNSPRSGSATGDRNGRRSANAVSATDSYSSPRSSRTYGRSGSTDNAGGRTSGESYSTRGASEGNNVYYSRPRSAASSAYTPDNSGGTTSRSSRGGSTYNSPTYSAPARSQSDYSAPTRSYSTPNRSESYSAPSRTYSQPSTPSYSAPSRSYSAPASSGGGGGGATRSSSRGPR
ncbi:hypothetical protein [Dyadobacter sp. CY323]|uniref:hypothetical protein n=1 Tax=Dyadobacter sp. CY323 TaxID=2907302 RepID=UPI001F3302C2|nr:hypothetical protein [Dyadobacter sp. CY323]MCE6987686.1 hypothetical protein [Dyadobacter sp. CY323]